MNKHDDEYFHAQNGEQPGLDLEAYHEAMKPQPLSQEEQLKARIAKERELREIGSYL